MNRLKEFFKGKSKQIIALIVGIIAGSILVLSIQTVRANMLQGAYAPPHITCCNASTSGEHITYDADFCLVHAEERTREYNIWLEGWLDELWEGIKDGWSTEYID